VVRAGRLLTVSQAQVEALNNGQSRIVALMTATLVTLEGRDGVSD
jgi:hypothetical protein